MELVFKRMKQLLRFNQLRSTHRTTVEATIRALLVAWALQDGIVAELRALLPMAHPGVPSDPPTRNRTCRWSSVPGRWWGWAWRRCGTRCSIGGRWPGSGPVSPACAVFCAAARGGASIRKPPSAPGWRGGIPRGSSWRTMPHEQYGLQIYLKFAPMGHRPSLRRLRPAPPPPLASSPHVEVSPTSGPHMWGSRGAGSALGYPGRWPARICPGSISPSSTWVPYEPGGRWDDPQGGGPRALERWASV